MHQEVATIGFDRVARLARPIRQDSLGVGNRKLLAEAALKHPDQSVVPLIRGTTDSIANDNNEIPKVDSAEDCRQNADVGFGAGHNQRIDAPLREERGQPSARKCRIDRFVDDPRWGAKRVSSGIRSMRRGSRLSRVACRHRS
jgi:hypothetical protein